MACGVFAAHCYMKILDFRRIPDEESRRKAHPIINYMHHSTLIHTLMFLLGIAIIFFCLLYPHTAIAHPYSWTMTENIISMALQRPVYVAGIWLIMFVFFTGGLTFGKALLMRPIFRATGKLTFEAALITPLMV